VEGGVSWACAEAAIATNINVAVSIDLMTSPEGQSVGVIDARAIKHICLVGNNCAKVQGASDTPSS
jgi:hypothetical protein